MVSRDDSSKVERVHKTDRVEQRNDGCNLHFGSNWEGI